MEGRPPNKWLLSVEEGLTTECLFVACSPPSEWLLSVKGSGLTKFLLSRVGTLTEQGKALIEKGWRSKDLIEKGWRWRSKDLIEKGWRSSTKC